jgi:hypothetical protein
MKSRVSRLGTGGCSDDGERRAFLRASAALLDEAWDVPLPEVGVVKCDNNF